jgi:Retinal pigment epithelial membrane protein
MGELLIPKPFPRSVLSVSREEFGHQADNPDATAPPLLLRVKAGQIPPDLQGFVFIVGPVGSVDSLDADGKPDGSVVIPAQDGTTLLYNGDGMIYRLDFSCPEAGVQLTSRLVKPPCYYADAATYHCPAYQGSEHSPDLRFRNYGITRLSGALGIRNQLNTAFVPLKFAADQHQRLLVTWDMGRPYEIDPQTLALVTPIGWNHEWREVTKLTTLPFQPPVPFKAIQSSAHPVFDPDQQGGELITTSSGRSLANLLSQLIPVIFMFQELWDAIASKLWGRPLQTPDLEPVPAYSPAHPSTSIGKKLQRAVLLFLQFIRGIVEFWTGNFLELIVWDGSGPLQKWTVQHQGQAIKIQQSTHQIGLTEDYIVIIDTAFKVSVEELLPQVPQKERRLAAWARRILDHPQLADNRIYIVRRRDLKPGVHYVDAQTVTIPYEAAHFLVDYKNPGGNITLHFSHVCAWDAGECISEFDFEETPALGDSPLGTLQRLYGVLYSPTDISRLGIFEVNGETGEIVPGSSDILMDSDLTWGPAIASFRSPGNGLPDRLEDIYWGCLGCWPELLLPHILELYKSYPYRQVGMDLIQSITQQGRNSNLLRVHITPIEQRQEEQSRLAIADAYEFPEGVYVTSPQFVPSSDRQGSTDGYVVCITHAGEGTDETNGNEIWIFEGRNLKQGPICQLWHPQLNFGFTVHATWIPTAPRRTADYCVPVRADFASIVEQQSPLVQDLFENWVFPQAEPGNH